MSMSDLWHYPLVGGVFVPQTTGFVLLLLFCLVLLKNPLRRGTEVRKSSDSH